jgi:transcriptional regulator with XRE-family HTH domain
MKPMTTPKRSAEQRAEEEAIRRQHAANPIRQRPASAINQQSFAAILSLVARFKAVRESQGLTLAEVAERMEINPPALSRLETGKVLNPTLDTLHKWAEALGRKLDIDLSLVSTVSPSKKDEKQAMTPVQAHEYLETLWANFHRVAEQVDLELMSPDRRDMLIKQNPPARPFLQAAWFGRQGFIISAWSLWEYYSRVLCEGLTHKMQKKPRESSVLWVGRSLVANSISFPRQDWFSGANALRNLIAHYSGIVIESGARRHFEKAKMDAFPELELYADNFVMIQSEDVSAFYSEIGEFIREMAATAAFIAS